MQSNSEPDEVEGINLYVAGGNWGEVNAGYYNPHIPEKSLEEIR